MQQVSKQLIKGLPRRIALMLLDCGLIVLCYWLAVMLRFDSGDAYRRVEILRAMAPMLLYVLPIYMIVFWFGGLYEIMWEYAGMRDLARLTCLSGLATGIIMLFDLIYHNRPISGAVLIFGAVFNTAAIAGVRFLWRLVLTMRNAKANKPEDNTPLLIVGAGNAGAWAVNLCKTKNQSFGNPVCIVDDDLTKKGLRVQGVPVRGTISDIPELVRKYHILEIVIAITTVKGDRLSEIINLCNSTHCRVRMISDPQAVDENGNPVAAGFRELNTADFLSRDEIQLNNAQISEYLHDKIVLVTGGGGSIGSELCRQIMRYQPRRLLIFDIYENCAYELETELKNKYGPEAPVITLIGSIRDKARLDEVFDTYHPSVVFHAAAHKHVPLMEISPAEAVKNNVFGTKNLLTSAAEHGVIPLFEEQIKRGGPVTITHPDIVRYFMTITEAAQLVLQAGGLAKGGSIYVLDMGEPVKIMDLANRLIRFYGYEPGVNMQVKVTGLRPGEKLYEELLMDSEQDKMAKTAHNKIFIAPPMQIDLEKFYTDLQRLKESARHNSDEVVDVLQEMVPTYHPNRRVRADHTVVAATGNTALFSREEIAQKLRETEHPAEEG